jgi:hypothetical protein
MSSKSRRKRGKHSFQAKKRKGRLTPAPIASQAPPAGEIRAPVASPPPASAPPVSAPAARAAPATSGYPYVAGELRRIGILAAIMVAALIILSQVLP